MVICGGDRCTGRRDNDERRAKHLRSDNGPEFVTLNLRNWLADTGAKTMYIEQGSPWENGYCESFNSKMRDEFLSREIFYSMKELRVLAER
jgi:transposase InsO family protein